MQPVVQSSVKEDHSLGPIVFYIFISDELLICIFFM